MNLELNKQLVRVQKKGSWVPVNEIPEYAKRKPLSESLQKKLWNTYHAPGGNGNY